MFQLDPFTRIILTMGIIILGVVLALALAQWFLDFSKELRYINGEIKRTHGSERRYWMKERRKLWLSIFPFIKR